MGTKRGQGRGKGRGMRLELNHIKEVFPILCRIPDNGLLFEPRHMAMAFMSMNGGRYPAAWDIAAVLSDIIEDEPYSKTMLRLQGYRALLEQFFMFADKAPGAYVRAAVTASRGIAKGANGYRKTLVQYSKRNRLTIPDSLLQELPDRLSTIIRVRITEPEMKHLKAQAQAKGYCHNNGNANLSAYIRHRLLDSTASIIEEQRR
jgi:hypothetical protein